MPDLLAGATPNGLHVTDLMSGEILQTQEEGKGFKFTKELAAGMTSVISIRAAG